MSAAVYAEPYKLPAGALALAVHSAFFALLYFGVSWQTQPPQGMVVDIWDSLPEMKHTPAKVAPPEATQAEPQKPVEPPKQVEPVQPVEPPKADIELAEKKKQKELAEKEKQKAKLAEIKKQMERKKIIEAEKAQQAAQAEQERAVQAAKQAAEAEAITNEVGKYMGLISSKIRRNIVMPPDVPDSARAEFDVTLLPDGEVLDAKLFKSSGNAAYDSAVERSILKAQPFPLPSDMTAKKSFLNPKKLQLKFSPKE